MRRLLSHSMSSHESAKVVSGRDRGELVLRASGSGKVWSKTKQKKSGPMDTIQTAITLLNVLSSLPFDLERARRVLLARGGVEVAVGE